MLCVLRVCIIYIYISAFIHPYICINVHMYIQCTRQSTNISFEHNFRYYTLCDTTQSHIGSIYPVMYTHTNTNWSILIIAQTFPWKWSLKLLYYFYYKNVCGGMGLWEWFGGVAGGWTQKRFYLYGLLKSIYNTLSTLVAFIRCI